MRTNLKKIAIALAFMCVGAIGFTTNAQAKTTWHKGMPKAVRGVWVAPNGKSQKDKSYGDVYAYEITASDGIEPLFHKDEIHKVKKSAKPLGYSYHHKKGSKYYYLKSSQMYTREGRLIQYTWIKVSGKKMSMSIYGEKTATYVDPDSSINDKLSPYGKFHKLPKHVTTWYKN